MLPRKSGITSVLLIALLVAGCDSIPGPELGPDLGGSFDTYALSDGSNGGTEGFFFLPPIARTSTYTGTFDASLSPVVEICEMPSCAELHASFSMIAGSGSEVVRLNADDGHYIVNWHTHRTGAVSGATYRIRVVSESTVLGFADVRISSPGRGAQSGASDDALGLVNGRTLPITFRIEKGGIARLEVSPTESIIDVGGSQQIAAFVYDLSGDPVTDASIEWSSSDESVATVDASGLATAVSAGNATITARLRGLTAHAVLTVEETANLAHEWFFSTCGATGNHGPSQAQCDDIYSDTPLAGAISISGGIQSWMVPVAGTYRITAVGAQGASGTSTYSGGRGARISGDFELAAGTALHLAVGQMGLGQGSGQNGGGGGGTFVVDASGQPMVIAGGGGGARSGASQNGCDASIGEYGILGSADRATSTCAEKTTRLGLGGIVSRSSFGSGGAGFSGNGANDSSWGEGGRSWGKGLRGGTALSDCSAAAPGGFGGGGAGNGCFGGGGGGGYSGGDGGRVAGGGGSYSAGANPSATAGAGEGHGQIHIERL
jgi:hypothetical protein